MCNDPRWRAIERITKWHTAPEEIFHRGIESWMVRVVDAWRSNDTDGSFDPNGRYVFVTVGVGARVEWVTVKYNGFNGLLDSEAAAILATSLSTNGELCDIVPYDKVPNERRRREALYLYMDMWPTNVDLIVFNAPNHHFEDLRLALPHKAFSNEEENYCGFVIPEDLLSRDGSRSAVASVHSPKFAFAVHRELTELAALGIFDDATIDRIVLANIAQDLRQFESKVHFDNCAFAEGAEYLAQEWQLIESEQDRFSDTALSALGRLLHTVQDFYSHSNWVELFQDQDPFPLWQIRAGDLPAEIVSGTWEYGEPKKCGQGAPTHDELNKDDPNSSQGRRRILSGPHARKTLYQLAWNAAFRATAEQLERFEGGNIAKLGSKTRRLSDA